MSKVQFSLDRAVPRYWHDGDAFQTRFLESMSLMAPEIERFLMRSVVDSLRDIDDARLAERCRAFVREEAAHSRAHRRFNRHLESQDLPVAAALAPIRGLIDWAIRRLPRLWRLEFSAAAEHLSASVSRRYLQAPTGASVEQQQIEQLFRSHAMEELGHCRDVYDLLRSSGAGRWHTRLLALMVVSCVATWGMIGVLDTLLMADAPGRRLSLWTKGLRWMLGPRGWLAPAQLLRDWARYLKPGFHPSDLTDTPAA